jgi:hypothetical protein
MKMSLKSSTESINNFYLATWMTFLPSISNKKQKVNRIINILYINKMNYKHNVKQLNLLDQLVHTQKIIETSSIIS